MYKFFLSLIFLFIFSSVYSQATVSHIYGEPSDYEFSITEYDRDPEAPAVVLYEKGEYTVDIVDRYVRLIKKVHRKVKVFDVTRYSDFEVEIPYYRERQARENVKSIHAITHNGELKSYLSINDIFDTAQNQNWSVKKFTFPDVQNGSIIEYTYQIETPYLSNIGNWYFGREIPTLYSELHTEIPANYSYNRTLYGDQKLHINHAEVLKQCFQPEGFKTAADCEKAVYAMQYVPAYSEEPYMLSLENYRPAIHFELVEAYRTEHDQKNFSKTWKDIDNRLKNSSSVGRQLKQEKYFEEKLPQQILSISDPLERAKKVYYFIQDHYTWNGKFRLMSDVDVKNAFSNKTGNVSEINFSLYNALAAAGINSEMMLLPTRDSAMATRQHPTLFSFNYTILYTQINGETYYLDATDKFTPFGVLPVRALNVEGRVFNMRKGSRWEPIVPFDNNMHYLNIQVSTDEKGIFQGKAQEVSTGYLSYYKHAKNGNRNRDYISKVKQTENENLVIKNFQIETEKDQPYKETFDFALESQQTTDRVFLYPFMVKPYFTENPFKIAKRAYPFDFGFPVTNNYLISIDLGDQYEVAKLPENKRVTFPENAAELTVVYETSGSKINIRLLMKLNDIAYPTNAIQGLQRLFSTLIDIQQNQPIELKKI